MSRLTGEDVTDYDRKIYASTDRPDLLPARLRKRWELAYHENFRTWANKPAAITGNALAHGGSYHQITPCSPVAASSSRD